MAFFFFSYGAMGAHFATRLFSMVDSPHLVGCKLKANKKGTGCSDPNRVARPAHDISGGSIRWALGSLALRDVLEASVSIRRGIYTSIH